eukprot:CAMPEP_0116029626 /NCGR_PEP_ID=MMETSP0321-20121206/16252_1 /TAXON_ID=163516 /ORGANISM="Leptocylindrus danicus var. danicus, Strain B650" /LENGTH=163 /DNA_ID=CAMNT_0003504039 /DNA_START=141 /DNA_END=632 /DNA_ORIENTATION=+
MSQPPTFNVLNPSELLKSVNSPGFSFVANSKKKNYDRKRIRDTVHEFFHKTNNGEGKKAEYWIEKHSDDPVGGIFSELFFYLMFYRERVQSHRTFLDRDIKSYYREVREYFPDNPFEMSASDAIGVRQMKALSKSWENAHKMVVNTLCLKGARSSAGKVPGRL